MDILLQEHTPSFRLMATGSPSARFPCEEKLVAARITRQPIAPAIPQYVGAPAGGCNLRSQSMREA